jgi:hypothetical protein
MNFLTPRLRWQPYLRLVGAVLYALIMPNAYCAWHEQQPGSDVPVHYVRLKGHSGDNEQNRKLLLIEHQACVARKAAFGQPYQPLDPRAVPPVISSRDVEIYYAANRTLTVTQGVAYQIDFDTCALKQVTGRTLKLLSSIGGCDIDFSKKQAKGACDTNAHAQSPSISHLTRPRPPPDTSQAPLPLETKTIGNTPCQVHRHAALNTEVCLANPTPAQGHALKPYPIPAAPFNGGNPGVLIDHQSPALTLKLQDIHWNMSVSEKLFTIPADFKVISIPLQVLR